MKYVSFITIKKGRKKNKYIFEWNETNEMRKIITKEIRSLFNKIKKKTTMELLGFLCRWVEGVEGLYIQTFRHQIRGSEEICSEWHISSLYKYFNSNNSGVVLVNNIRHVDVAFDCARDTKQRDDGGCVRPYERKKSICLSSYPYVITILGILTH